MNRSISFTVIFILTITAYSQYPYTPQGIGGGGAMTSFSISGYDEDLWFVATDMGILFRSTNGGESWMAIDQKQIQFSSNLDYAAPIGFCADPDVVFFVNAGKSPLKSTNKGETWFAINIPLEDNERIRYWVANSEDENTILCATDQRLFLTTDKGNTWDPCNISGPSRGTFFDYEEGYIYHATTEGIYRSNDSGETFELYHVPEVLPLHSFAGGRDANGLTLAYIDGDGENAVGLWIEPYIGLVDGASQESYDRSVATSGFVWIKSYEDEDFHKVEHHQTYDRIDVESEYLYGGGDIRLAGQTVYDLPETEYNLGCLFMAENDAETIWVTGNIYWPRMYGTKTFVTEDAGETWEKRFHINDWDAGYTPWPADKLEWSPVGMEVGWWDDSYDNFYVCRTNSSMAGGTGYFFLHATKDKGQHWLAPFTEFMDTEPREPGDRWRSTGLEVTSVYRIEFHPANPQIMYAGLADISGYASEDGGATIRMVGSEYNSIYDYAFDPANDNVVYAAMSSEHDWPNDWHKHVSEGRGGIFRSNNRGRTWSRLTPDNDSFNRNFLAVAYDPNREYVYAGSWGDGVARSIDNGTTWEYTNEGIPETRGRIIPHIELDSSGNVYALLTGDYIGGEVTNQAYTGIYFLDVVNEATSWELLRDSLHLPNDNPIENFWNYPTSFAVDPTNSDILWLGEHEAAWMSGGVWKTTDRGENWHMSTQFTHCSDIIVDPDNHDHIFASGLHSLDGGWGQGGLWFTTDGGETWQKNTRVPYKSNASCATLDPNNDSQIWYGFHGSGMLYGPRPDELSIVKPTEPQNVQATATGSDRIQVTWEASTSDSPIKGYLLFRSYRDTADRYHSSPITYATPDSRSFTDIGLMSEWDYSYKIWAEDEDGDYSDYVRVYTTTLTAGVNTEKDRIKTFALSQNYPNPFISSAVIKYQLPKECDVSLKIYDLLGREIITLVNGQKSAGRYQAKWDGATSTGQKAASGVYFYQLKAGDDFKKTKKMLLAK